MENKPESGKYVRINPKLSAIEIDLPPNLEKYGDELREKIRQEFSFKMMDNELEARVQDFVEDFLRKKGEI